MELLNNDTICAISTPPGVGGIAVIRISGPEAVSVVESVWKGIPLESAKSHTAHLGTLVDDDASALDQCVATIFKAPRSYTGEDTVELSVHGSTYIQQAAVSLLCRHGARLAQPGEFTRRAFSSGNIDLIQAEAIADLIAARSRAAHNIAIKQMRGQISTRLESLRNRLIDLGALLELELDFSEEDVEFADRTQLIVLATDIDAEISRLLNSFSRGSAIKQGIPVAIVGPTNVGKSSLLNALVDDDRAIVSDIHGTTRDLVEDTVVIDDYQFRFIDTAGIRQTSDTIEAMGIQRTLNAISRASIVIQVIDSTRPETDVPIDVPPTATLIRVLNKIDIARADSSGTEVAVSATTPGTEVAVSATTHGTEVAVSATTGQGIDLLRKALTASVGQSSDDNDILLTNIRQQQSLQAASESVVRMLQGLRTNLSGDFIAQDLRETIHHLSTLTGAITTDTLLHTIFSRFCVGK